MTNWLIQLNLVNNPKFKTRYETIGWIGVVVFSSGLYQLSLGNDFELAEILEHLIR